MNTNKILRESEYHSSHQFGEIAQWVSTQKFASKESLLKAVKEKYTVQVKKNIPDQPAPYTLFAPEGIRVEEEAFNQLKKTLRIPGAVGGAGMPDIHPGYGMPIGGVGAFNNVIFPFGVGKDISCSVSLSMFHIGSKILDSTESRENFLKVILAVTSFGLGASTDGLDHPVMHDPRWKSSKLLKRLKPLAQSQLGSSGGGNHFADLVQIHFPDGSDGGIGLLTHSGSRGTGSKIADYYSKLADELSREEYKIETNYGWFQLDSPEGLEYWDAMQLMGDYATANHQIIHECFAKAIGEAPYRREINKHNFAWKEEYEIDGKQVELVIHRKGATPAHYGEIGIIPGSSGTTSFLVVGKGNPASYNSSSHGAGRMESSTAAKIHFDQKLFDSQMNGITYVGVAPHEGFAAYKPIEKVMEAQKELVTVIARLRPRLVVMGNKMEDGD